MQLTFEVDGQTAEFRRNQWTGRSDLVVGDEVTCLESPFKLRTHFNHRTQTVWTHEVGGHEIAITKVRPRALGGARPNSYTIAVDGDVVTHAREP